MHLRTEQLLNTVTAIHGDAVAQVVLDARRAIAAECDFILDAIASGDWGKLERSGDRIVGIGRKAIIEAQKEQMGVE